MTKTFIVGPFYYIPKTLRKQITDDTIIIITDDVSPIFPLDFRMEWLNFTFMDKELELDSMIHNDESGEFAEAVLDHIKKILHDDEGYGEEDNYRVILYTHQELPLVEDENPGKYWSEEYYITSPLVAKEDEMDDVFVTRFGKQFNKFILPKVKPLGQEMNYIIPFFTETTKDAEEKPITHRYYGAYWNYAVDNLDEVIQFFAFPIDFATSVMETKTIIKLFCEKVIDATPISERLVGFHNDLPIWVVEIPKPGDINTSSAKGLRRYLAVDADITFIRDTYLRDAVGGGFGYKIETLHKEALEDAQT